jgi:hypothetical protein
MISGSPRPLPTRWSKRGFPQQPQVSGANARGICVRDGQPGIPSGQRSLRQPHPAQQVGVAGIGAQLSKSGMALMSSKTDSVMGNPTGWEDVDTG